MDKENALRCGKCGKRISPQTGGYIRVAGRPQHVRCPPAVPVRKADGSRSKSRGLRRSQGA